MNSNVLETMYSNKNKQPQFLETNDHFWEDTHLKEYLSAFMSKKYVITLSNKFSIFRFFVFVVSRFVSLQSNRFKGLVLSLLTGCWKHLLFLKKKICSINTALIRHSDFEHSNSYRKYGKDGTD